MAQKNTERFLRKASIPEEHAYGTAANIQARDKVAHQPKPTTFQQVGPEDNEGLDLANPVAADKSGTFKFSPGV